MTHSSPINEKQDPIEVIDRSPSFKGESRKEQQEEKNPTRKICYFGN